MRGEGKGAEREVKQGFYKDEVFKGWAKRGRGEGIG